MKGFDSSDSEEDEEGGLLDFNEDELQDEEDFETPKIHAPYKKNKGSGSEAGQGAL